jgi:hypothetical protein
MNMPLRQRLPRWESKKLRDSARGRDCTILSPWCQNRRETVVWCHSPFQEHGKGMGVKAHDLFGCYGCFECHTFLDLASKQEAMPHDERLLMFYRANSRSLLIVVQEGILK